MGMLIEGRWVDNWYDTDSNDGEFVRPQTQFRSFVQSDANSDFPAQAGRYHLYVSLACPWACRTLVMRELKGLQDVVSVSIVDFFMGDDGWFFSDAPGTVPDTVNGHEYLRDVYRHAKSDYTGRVTVPVLWDKTNGTIVSNESADILRMLNSAFDEFASDQTDYYPEPLRGAIDAVNRKVYDNVNNGVYRAGFATKQTAYEDAVSSLFATLDELEEALGRHRYVVGDQMTEADIRLWTTLVRFDPVYYGHFKCNLRRLVDYPNLWGFTRDIYQMPGVAQTVDFDHIQGHYYRSHPMINPTRIVPAGPIVDFDEPHGRG